MKGAFIMAVLTITASNYEQEVSNSTLPVLLDFWASWCGPCRMQSPIVDELADTLTDVKVGKVNVDEEQELAARFGIQSIPTLVVLENGQIRTSVSGVQSKKSLLKMLGKE